MNRRISLAFLLLIIQQAIHSVEEFIFRFYERFPPMKIIYQDAPHLAKPAFLISNALLFLAGLFCFFYWVRPVKERARIVVWVWIALETVNVIAHFIWAILIRGYNPGLVTVILFVPVLIYLNYLMRRSSPNNSLNRTRNKRAF
jgi:hypothetical protein